MCSGNDLTITTEAPRIIKIMVVVIICIKTSKLAAVLWPLSRRQAGGLAGGWLFLPAAVETLRLGFGRSVPAGAAHGAAAPLLAPRPFKLPGLPPWPPTHTHTRKHTPSRLSLARSLSSFLSLALSLSLHCTLSPSKYTPPPHPPTNPPPVGRSVEMRLPLASKKAAFF